MVVHHSRFTRMLSRDKQSSPYWYSLLILLLFSSCNPAQEAEYDVIDTGIEYDLYAIASSSQGLHSTGGFIWNNSQVAFSEDGTAWSVDSLSDKAMYDILVYQDQVLAVGGSGYLMDLAEDNRHYRLRYWGIIRSLAKSRNGYIAVGGKDWNKGFVYPIANWLQADTAYIYPYEMAGVHCIDDDNTCIAVGYGHILRTEDGGYTWELVDLSGDFYTSVTQDSRGRLWIVGLNGTIGYSDDDGQTWDQLSRGRYPWVSSDRWRAVHFDQGIGVVLGADGHYLLTRNDGGQWDRYSTSSAYDLRDAAIYNGRLYLATIDGQLLKVAL